MVNQIFPLAGDPPKEIPLKNAPLARVLCQVQFNDVLSISDERFIAAFQEEIRQIYPVLRKEEVEVVSLAGSRPEVKKETLWRFYDENTIWRVSLTHDFVSIETLNYSSRNDFVDRIGKVVNSAQKTIGIDPIKRIGVRYIDRILTVEPRRLQKILNQHVVGILASEFSENIDRSMTEFFAKVSNGELIARWGFVPANSVYEQLLSPLDKKSWVLDIDVYTTPELYNGKIHSQDAVTVSRELAERAYAFFRWAVTDDFLNEYREG
ncbi:MULTISPECIES: TIGR04255 family protein [unclassified Roseibium]|uniref:TIGR04255 family protein n=1 Tax=unclassified Roseibium TaxID=2629323 RepID=UPI0027402E00|nr:MULTISPECIES: TIGR04255 family protein [unclassified Roseibium]